MAVTHLFAERRCDLQHPLLAAGGKWQAQLTVDPLHLAHGVGGEILQPHFREVAGRNPGSIRQIVHLRREIFAGDDLLLLVLGQWRLQGERTLQFARQKQVGPEHDFRRTGDVDELGARKQFQEVADARRMARRLEQKSPPARNESKLLDEGELM